MGEKIYSENGRIIWTHITTSLQRNAEGKPLFFAIESMNYVTYFNSCVILSAIKELTFVKSNLDANFK